MDLKGPKMDLKAVRLASMHFVIALYLLDHKESQESYLVTLQMDKKAVKAEIHACLLLIYVLNKKIGSRVEEKGLSFKAKSI